MIYHCCNEKRKAAVLGNPGLNGIDFLEVMDTAAEKVGIARQQSLLVHCINPLPPSAAGGSSSAPGPAGASSSSSGAAPGTGWSTANVMILGGETVTQIGVTWVGPALEAPSATPQELAYYAGLEDRFNVLLVRTSERGDFSTYTLRLVNDAVQAALDPFAVTETLSGFDPQLAEVAFSFKVECDPVFDCAPQPADCPPNLPPPPPINYLAKDYGSFRSVMLDRLAQLLPAWGGTSEADIGVTLAEVLAYVGDRLSYQQDAVATEAYLLTARRRVSLRRHALLVDYHVHDGCNARAWIHVEVGVPPIAGTAVVLGKFSTRFSTIAAGMPADIGWTAGNEEATLLSGAQVFEPLQDAELYPEHNTLQFYTWGDTGCCLPAGATEATLRGTFENLQPGDVLIFEEVLGPQTGVAADADIRHRCAVRLTQVTTRDGRGNLLQDALFDPAHPVPLTEIQWASSDRLPFPLCLSSNFIAADGTNTYVDQVSVARGNVVLADHGISFTGTPLGTVPQPRLSWPPDPAQDRCDPKAPEPVPVRFRPVVPDAPLTQAVPLPLAGIPVTAAPVGLSGLGYVSLTDASGLVSLLVQAEDPAGWPARLAVVVSAGAAAPPTIEVSVVFGTDDAGITLESFAGLSLDPGALNYAGRVINARSQLVRVPASFAAPAASALAGVAAGPTAYPLAAGVVLNDQGSPPTAFLELEPTSPLGWPALFGVLTQPLPVAPPQEPAFNLVVVYNPPLGGRGVTLPVTVQSFAALTLTTASGTLGLVKVRSFEDAPSPGLGASDIMDVDPGQAVPEILLHGPGPVEGTIESWSPLQDLLESAPTDTVFVVEVEADGTASLRFGDDSNGLRPEPGASFTADYRIGNGVAGNVGADSIVNLASPEKLILGCRNPLPAVGGTDPETSDQIRRRAPRAFLTQERAVTMADYEAMATLSPQVNRAAASLRWTGSWYTVFTAVEPQGGVPLTGALRKAVKRGLERYRLAGQDLEVDAPDYVALEITLMVCVDPDYFQADVVQALMSVLSNRVLPNGQKGVFHPDNFSFGQTVYLSPVYAAARSVAGVQTVVASVFQKQGVPTNAYLDSGEIKLGPTQVARLDNDPSAPDHGQLTIKPEGGKP